MASKKYKSWSQKHDEAKDLLTQFELFSTTNGAEGINPKISSLEIRQLYDSTPALHDYNPKYFRQNFKNLVTAYEINKSLTSGRRE